MLSGTRRLLVKRGTAPVVLSAAVPVLGLTLTGYATAGRPSGLWLGALVGIVVLLLLAAALFGSAALLLVRSARRWALACLPILAACLVAVMVSLLLGLATGSRARMFGFEQLAQRSAPLVEAITGYERRYGHPPSTLQALIPEFLAAVPGAAGSPHSAYEYRVCGADERADMAGCNGNPWILRLSTPSGPINFDEFLYYPLQNYPESNDLGWLERIEDWAYLHE